VMSLEDLEATLDRPVLAVLPVVNSRDAAASNRHLASRRTRQDRPPSGASHPRFTGRS
jgi:hypothetical protein